MMIRIDHSLSDRTVLPMDVQITVITKRLSARVIDSLSLRSENP